MPMKVKRKRTHLAVRFSGAILLAGGVATLVAPIPAGAPESSTFNRHPACGFEPSAAEAPPYGGQTVAVPDEPEGTIREATAYNVGDPDQTDDSPCLTADGSNACEELARGKKICAANFVPIGTKLIITGIGICTVKDRMHRRFKDRVDIAMQAHEKQRARKFGLQKLEVRVLK